MPLSLDVDRQESQLFNTVAYETTESLMGPWQTPDPDPTPEQFQELDDLIDEMPIFQVEQLLASNGKWADTDTLSFWTATRARMNDLLDSIHETLSQGTT